MAGAFRLAAFTFFLMVSIWIVSPHVDDVADEQTRLFTSVGLALFVAGALYLLYLGLEPFVRRSWPTMLVGWSRLLAGRIRDPLIGRDILRRRRDRGVARAPEPGRGRAAAAARHAPAGRRTGPISARC